MKETQIEKQALDRLQESEAAYRTLAENVPDIVYRLHLQGGGMQFFNDRITDITGYRKDELVGGCICSMESRIVDEDRQRVIDSVKQAVRERVSFEVEYRFLHKNGTVLTLLERGAVVPDEAGTPLHIDGVIRDITERKRAEDRLRESEGRFRALFENLNVVALVIDPSDGRILAANEAAVAYYGWPRERLLSILIWEINTLPTDEILKRMDQVKSGKKASFILQHRRADGSVRDVEVHSGPIPYDGVTALCSIIHDITERKRAEEALRSSEERFRVAFQTSPDAVVISRLADGMCVSINKGFSSITGYDESEAVGRTTADLNIWDDLEARKKMAEDLRSTGTVRNLEARFRTKQGKNIYGLVSASIINIDGVPHIMSVTRDITERKQAEEEARRSKEVLEKTFRGLDSALFILDNSQPTVIMDCNPSASRIFGYEREELLGKTTSFLHVNAGSLAEFHKANSLAIARQGFLSSYEFRMKRKNGEVFSSEHSVYPLLDDHGVRTGWVSVVKDITGRKKSESDRELFRNLIDRSNDAIFVNDPYTGRFIDMNDRACSSLGYGRDELLKIGVKDIEGTFPDDRAWRAHVADVQRWGSLQMEGMHKRKDGTAFPVEISVSYVELGAAEYMIAVVRDISERKQADAALRERERRLAESQRIAHIGSWEHNLKSGRVFWSDELFRLLGLDPRRDPADFNLFFKMVHPDDQPVLKNAIDTTLREKKPFSIVYRLILKERTTRVIEAQAEIVPDDSGEPVILSGTAQDITERRRQEQALQKSEKMLQTIFDAEPECVKLLDADANLILMNRAGLEMLQVDSLDQVKGTSVCPMVTSEYRGAFMDLTKRVFQGASGTLEFEMVGMRGRRLWMETHAVPLRNEKDEIVALLGVTRDTTARRQAEQERERLAKAVSVVTEGIALTDEQDRFIYVNDAHAKYYGYEPHELLGKTWRYLTPGEFVPLIERVLARTLHSRENGVWSGESPGLCRDGARITTEITATARWSENGQYLGHICVVRDVTERKRTDEALRASEARFRTIIETASSGILAADVETMQFLYANPEICRMLGYSSSELLALDIASIHPASELTRIQRSFAAREGLQTSCQRKDGTVFPVEIRSVEIELDGRRCLAEFFTDISEKRLLEEERLKTQKLESVGTLAGGIAHDFNNLLQGVFGYISMAKLTLDQRERSLAMLEQAEKALHQSVHLTTQLLTFSKGGKPVKRPMDLRPVIENAVKFALSGSRTDCRIDIAEGLPSVDADEGQISQMIQNIVLNADQAMPTGGTVEIAAKDVVAPGGGSPRSLAAGRYVEITISDTGIGIPGQYLDKIFDPYFTTKEKGSGLGLATSYSIISNHGGAIDVRSEVGKGSSFLLYLPVSSAAPEPRETAAVPAAGKGRRILVMDDEELVRNVAEELIRELGHEVLCAADGAAAIDAYRRAKEAGLPYDIVILDLTVRGGIGGMETLRGLQEIDPAVKAVVSSGYSDDEVVSDFRKYGFSGFLKKPYDLAELRETLSVLMA